jgi:hypothetical protein
MEIKDLESFYINESSQTLDVTFRILSDNDDEIRADQIDLSETKTFGYNFSKDDTDDLWDEDDDEDYFDTYGEEFDMDEEEMISFLNEYYLIYPNRLPNTQLY